MHIHALFSFLLNIPDLDSLNSFLHVCNKASQLCLSGELIIYSLADGVKRNK